MRGRRDRGETLIEIVITVVITSITVTALVSSLATTGNAGRAQRDSVRADTVMRNYAEAVKHAARACTDGGDYRVDYTPPDGVAVASTPADTKCPPVDEPLTLMLSVASPGEQSHSMQIVLRTP